MSARQFRGRPGLLDRVLEGVDNALRTVLAEPVARRPSPALAQLQAPVLSSSAKAVSAPLMRINHAGEVAAQALYQGQALVARTDHLRAFLLKAAQEEADHLAWTHQRLQALETHPSRLTAVWYGGAFVLGAAAGMLSDRASLGFLSETERQVEAHLAGHLQKLPAEDLASRAVCEQMMADEASHGRAARAEGGSELPQAMRLAMQAASKAMIATAARI